MQKYETSAQLKVYHYGKYGSQGHIMPRTTAPFDVNDTYGCPSRLVLDLNDDNDAISSLYRSDEI